MTKPEILIIDDQAQWGHFLINLLNDEYSVHFCTTLNDALNLIENNPNIQIAITDLAVATYKTHSLSLGNEIINALKKRRPNLPIIAYSSFVLDNFSYKNLGVDLFFTKSSLSGIELKTGIKKLLTDLVNLNVDKKEEERLLLEARKILKEELANYAMIKEKTLSIPEEGNFELIKPLIGFKRDIERQLSKFEYSKNVFLMMKFRNNNKDLSDYIIDTLERNGLNGVRADQNEWNITQNVYNPIAVLHCCKYGIALFDEAENNQAYSPNVAYELGIMHTHNKNCLILRHSSLPSIPFDLIKEIYVSYEKDLEVKNILLNWIYQIRLQ